MSSVQDSSDSKSLAVGYAAFTRAGVVRFAV